MKKTVTFKIEAEIVVEYKEVEGLATTPYTKMGCAVNKDGHLEIVSTVGEIKDGTLLSLKRVSE